MNIATLVIFFSLCICLTMSAAPGVRCILGYYNNMNIATLVIFFSLCIFLTMSAAPGWSIWSGGMWNIPDDDGDNIPGVGGNDYPVNGQKELCALNPTNPGC